MMQTHQLFENLKLITQRKRFRSVDKLLMEPQKNTAGNLIVKEIQWIIYKYQKIDEGIKAMLM